MRLGEVAFKETDVVRALCRESYHFFLKEFWGEVVKDPFYENWHIKKICDELQYLVEWYLEGNRKGHDVKFDSKPYDLIINQPPGTTKSILVTVFLQPWIWTRDPSFIVISSSYNENQSIRLSRFSRELIKSEKYRHFFPEVQISSDQDAKGNFANTAGGERISCGCRSVTGKHAHMLCIDDPIDPEGVRSMAEITETNLFLRETLMQRKKNPARTFMVMVQQRLHSDDPTGMFMSLAEQGAMKIRHICLPGVLTPDVKPKAWAKYYQDGLFDPVRFPKKVLDEKELLLGQYGWAGQILQSPKPLGGGMFKTDNLHIVESHEVPEERLFVKRVRFWDKAATEGAGCFTVGALLGRDRDQKFWILDVVRGRWDSAKREAMIEATAMKDEKSVIVGVEQEPGSGGKDSAIATVRRLGVYGFRVVVQRATGPKELRADPFSSQVNAGNVYMVRANWNRAFVDEMSLFPNSTYLDQVDAASGAFSLLTNVVKRVGSWR